jgi:pimeloyl-ACP methyl ester carboxylesterase
MLGVDVPVTLLRGDPTLPLIATAVERLAAAMPGTELVVVPESHDHGVDPGGTVREVRARISATGCSPAAATTTSGHHQ